jgi:hypothetical protein
MNAASQLLRILAIVGAIAAGALFYLSSSKSGGFSLGGSSAQVTDLQSKLTAAQTGASKAAQALSDAQADAAVADSARAQAVAALNEDDKKVKALQSASDDKDNQITDLTTKLGSIDDLQKQISDLKTQNTQLQQQIAAGPVAPAPAANNNEPAGTSIATTTSTATAPAPAPVQLTAAAPAKIISIDTKDWLMELNIGTSDGVQKDSQLQLKVGDADIGTAVVRDSHDGFSVVAITSTGGIPPDDYSKIVKKNLNVQYQRVM